MKGAPESVETGNLVDRVLTPFQRADAYAATFPDRVEAGGGFTRGKDAATGRERVFASWMGGQDYRNKSGMYGAYPAGYLERVFSMFPDARRVLHLFSGSLTAEQVNAAWCAAMDTGQKGSGNPTYGQWAAASKGLPTQIRFDSGLHPAARAAKPDVIGDAQNLYKALVDQWIATGNPKFGIDLILADPPYRLPDQRRYWREAMESIEVPCRNCARPPRLHAVKYGKSTRDGRLLCTNFNDGQSRPMESLEYNADNSGYTRFAPLNKKLVLAECAKVLRPGGNLVWLDETIPMHANKTWDAWGKVTWFRSTGHRVRALFFYERKRRKWRRDRSRFRSAWASTS